jgi:hypothetical protein
VPATIRILSKRRKVLGLGEAFFTRFSSVGRGISITAGKRDGVERNKRSGVFADRLVA